eukprot:9474688-Pyramimonas_sp.AAC.1
MAYGLPPCFTFSLKLGPTGSPAAAGAGAAASRWPLNKGPPGSVGNVTLGGKTKWTSPRFDKAPPILVTSLRSLPFDLLSAVAAAFQASRSFMTRSSFSLRPSAELGSFGIAQPPSTHACPQDCVSWCTPHQLLHSKRNGTGTTTDLAYKQSAQDGERSSATWGL